MTFYSIQHSRRIFLTILVMICVAIFAMLTMGWVLYQEAVKEQTAWLEKLVQDEADLITAIYQFDKNHKLLSTQNVTITEIAEERGRSGKFGETGEVVLARLVDGKIQFLLHLRHAGHENLAIFEHEDESAEPMRRALAGESGVLIGADYRNVTVLAAYQPVPAMGIGIVAKIDLSELRDPLIKKSLTGGIAALIIIIFGAFLAFRITSPLLDQLKESVNNLNEVQHIVNLGSWFWDIQSGKEVWSDEQFRIFGFKPDEIRPNYKTFLNAIHPDDLSAVQLALDKTLKQGKAYHMEFRIFRQNGELRHVDARGTMHRDKNKQPLYMLGTLLDITQQKQLECFLKQERERAQEYLQISQAMIVALDREGKITLINRRGQELLGYTETEIIGLNWFETIVSKDLSDELLIRHQAIFNGTEDCVEFEDYTIVTATGKHCEMSWHNTVKKDNENNIIASLNSGVDVSRLKQAERVSRHMAHHDALTGLPNRALFHDRLSQAIAQAQRHDSLVGLLYLDLDNFKPVNDNLGHASGDLLLTAVAERLNTLMRKEDTVARMGGDEFTVIITAVKNRETVENMRQKISAILQKPYEIFDQNIQISASIGLALYPLDSTEIDQLLVIADNAMYKNKKDSTIDKNPQL